MRISHNHAIELEAVVRQVFNCDRAGMGGYIDADHFEHEPFDAALIALAPLWHRGYPHEIEDFLYNWEHQLRDDYDDTVNDLEYIHELDNLVKSLMDR